MLDPEVKYKAQLSLALSRKKSHADLPYYVRRKSTHLAHAECGGFRTAKGAHILKNDTFQALIAGNKKASAATMVTTMRLAKTTLAKTKFARRATPFSVAAVACLLTISSRNH